MSQALLPQSFWFRLALPCRKVDGLPRKGRGRLLDLPDACLLPETATINGEAMVGSARAAWCAEGLALQFESDGNLDALKADDRQAGLYGVELWVDTRDTRDVNRATRFCHRFDARLFQGSTKAALGVSVQQRPIARAVADAPTCEPDTIEARADRLKKGWRLELFLSAGALHGYDPETNRRLGFAYRISDPERGDQYLGVGREFPVGENPSLWSTLELRDE